MAYAVTRLRFPAEPEPPVRRWPDLGWHEREPRLCRLAVHDLPVVAEDHFRGVTSLQRGPSGVAGLRHPIADV